MPTSKKYCVIAGAPASSFRFRLSRSSAGLAAWGCVSGYAATLISKSATSRRPLTKSLRSRTPGVRIELVVRRVAAKRDDMTYPRFPISLSDCVDFLPGSSDAGQCAAADSEVSVLIRFTVLWVRSRVLPPAP